MVFNVDAILFILLGLVVLWLIVLSVVVRKMVKHYSDLTKDVSGTGLKQVLETILQRQKQTTAKLKQTEQNIIELNEACTFHVQQVGIIRFNPFDDTGGSQSFSLALLDGKDAGIVVTSLHGRTGNRWYLKEIESGTGKTVELSKEEKAAIKKAREK